MEAWVQASEELAGGEGEKLEKTPENNVPAWRMSDRLSQRGLASLIERMAGAK